MKKVMRWPVVQCGAAMLMAAAATQTMAQGLSQLDFDAIKGQQLEVELNQVLELNSQTNDSLYLVSEEAYRSCSAEALSTSLEYSFIFGEAGIPVEIVLRGSVAEQEVGVSFEAGGRYHFIRTDLQNSAQLQQRCEAGDGFSLAIAELETETPDVTLESLAQIRQQLSDAQQQVIEQRQKAESLQQQNTLLADLNFLVLSTKALNASQIFSFGGSERGGYQVSGIDGDGRLRLSDLDGRGYDMRNVPSYNTHVRWSIPAADGGRSIARGRIGWTAADGGYSFLIRNSSEDAFPQRGLGLVIETH